MDDWPAGPCLFSPYEQVVWVYRAVNAIAEQVANIPFVFSAGERGRESLITSGPLYDFYAQPHPHIDRFQYWELRVLWLLLRGECVRVPIYHEPFRYEPQASQDASPRLAGEGSRACPDEAAIVFGRKPMATYGAEPRSTLTGPAGTLSHPMGEGSRMRAGLRRSRLKSVLILDPSKFQHIIQDHELVGWRYTGFGPNAPLQSQLFLPDELWFEKLPNPFDFWRGLSPLSVAAMAAGADFASAAFMKGVLENNGDSGLIVRTSDQLSNEQRAQVLAALSSRKRRAGTADRPLLLWSGAEVIKPSLSSADMQFLENRKFSRAEICAAFGVPEEIVTTTDHNKYDVMQGKT